MNLRTEILNHMTMEEYVALRERLSDDISIKILQHKPEEWDLEPSYKIVKDGKITTRGESGDYETQNIVMYESDVQANMEDKDVFDDILYHFMDRLEEDMGVTNENYGNIEYDPNQMYIYYNIVSWYGEYTGNMYYGYTGAAGDDGNVDEGLGQSQCFSGEQDAMNDAGVGEQYNDSLCISNQINYVIYINNANGEGYFVFEDPDNVGSFLEITRDYQNVDPEKARSILDTSIQELIPTQATRQQYINRFFNDYAILKGNIPNWIYDNLGNATAPDEYSETHDISNTSGDESNKFITRLMSNEDTDNTNKSLQWLRDDINAYLKDLEYIAPTLGDQRPEYENKQDGFLSIRNMNQAVIVRKIENDQSDLLKTVDITGTPMEIEWSAVEAPSYLGDGFTISMWVKFLDKVSSGTLFNFGNPLRESNPFGISLETYVIDDENNLLPTNNNDGTYSQVIGDTNPNGELFNNDHYERFLRLVVRELPTGTYPRGKIRSSFVGSEYYGRGFNNGFPTVGFDGNPSHGIPPNQGDSDQWSNSLGLFNAVKVPHNLDEWYFIVASYDPFVDEDTASLPKNIDYWMRHTLDGGTLVHDTREGLRCKVEIISRTDLLRARGFKTETGS